MRNFIFNNCLSVYPQRKKTQKLDFLNYQQYINYMFKIKQDTMLIRLIKWAGEIYESL